MSYEVFEYLNKIEARLNNLQYQQKAAFVACCAETNAPLVELFGEELTVKFYQKTLEHIWRFSILLPLHISNEIDEFLQELDFLPEANEDDSNSKEFRVMKGLGTLHHVLMTIKDESLKDIIFVSKTSQSNKNGIEFDLLPKELYEKEIRHDDTLLPLTPFQIKEVTFQNAILDLIEKQQTPNQQLIEILKVKSKEYASEFAVEVKKYGERMNFL